MSIERRQQAHAAPAAYLAYHGDVAEAVIEATGERLPYEESRVAIRATARLRRTWPTRTAPA